MSRETPRRRVRKFFRRGEWTPEESRAAGPYVGFNRNETRYKPIEMPNPNTTEIGARNRSGERRRTGKTLNDL